MTSALKIQRKSAPYIPSWPLLPPDEPYVRFCYLVWDLTEQATIECIQQEKKRVIKLWNELKDEDKEVYYKEYQDDFETYSRLQMVICGCHTCKQAVSKHEGVIDVTYFISKLKHNQDKRKSSLGPFHKDICETQMQNISKNCTLPTQIDAQSTLMIPFSCDVEDRISGNSSIKTNPDNSELTDKFQPEFTSGKNVSSVKRKCSNDDYPQLLLSKKLKQTNAKEHLVDDDDDTTTGIGCKDFTVNSAKQVSVPGYPFTTSNCMDFSGDESDMSDETNLHYFTGASKTLLNSERSSPIITSHQGDPDAVIPSSSATGCMYFADSPTHVPSVIGDDVTPGFSPDSPLAVMAVSDCPSFSNLETSAPVNDVPSPSLDHIMCLPLSADLSEKLKPSLPSQEISSQTSKLTCAFLEIKRICIEMILEKLRYFKSFENETDDPTEKNFQIPNLDMYKEEINEDHERNKLEKCLPEFVPISNTFSPCTWELLIENEARRNYNRKVTLKLNWTSKGGERIQCVDSNGMALDVRGMQPFVRLKPLKSLKTPIVLKTHGEHLLSGMKIKRATLKPKRNVRNSMKFRQFRSRKNFRGNIRRKEKERGLDVPVVCNVCNLGFTEQKALTMHRASCNDVQLVKDESLEPILEGLSLNCLHDQDREKTDLIQHCSVCPKTSTDHILREIHLFVAHKTKSLCCNICGFTFQDKATYLIHMVEHQTLQCMICKLLFKATEELNQHLSFHHQLFNCHCEKCGKVLPTIFAYQRHMLAHLTIRPFSCSMCTKRFKSKHNLIGHLWTHKPHRFKCTECLQSFPRPHLLNAHTRKAHGYPESCKSLNRE